MALNGSRHPLVQKLVEHCRSAFGMVLEVMPWDGASRLPYYLQGRYHFFKADGTGNEFLFAVLNASEEFSPVMIGRQMNKAREFCGGEVVFVSESISNAARKRMVEDKIPFIVPGTQLYMPMLGMDFKEKFVRNPTSKIAFSPSTQALLLDILYNPGMEVWTPTMASKRLGLSIMTMARAFNEIDAAKVLDLRVKGMERQLRVPVQGKKLWELVAPKLKSPIRQRLFIPRKMVKQPKLKSGDSALEELTDLSSSGIPVFAIGPKDGTYTSMKQHAYPKWEKDAAEVEFWSYSPSLFAVKGVVDRLSLYLATDAGGDERVEMAKKKLLKDLQW